jgi:uncharacterized membrane protein YczE
MFGNDPVGLVYDGIRSTFHYSQIELGVVSNYINIGLILILLFFGRKYVNIGTFLYLIPYGLLVSFGSHLYQILFNNGVYFNRILGGLFGCTLYYVGISLFVASNIGVDPFNGLMLTIRDKTKWSMRRAKITMDICLIVIGIFLGGKFGIITIFTALTTGPTIQYLSQLFEKKFLRKNNTIEEVI